jgi:hypothetical protein
MSSSPRDTIVIEPRSRIASFDTLGYYTTMAVTGAIAGALFGKDKEKSASFYKSKANLKNKQILAQLTSEVYSYLNSVISDFADPEDYYFRLWVRVEIDRKNGAIVSEPLFEIEMFKYTGKLGGKYVEVGDYCLDVVFIGREGTLITPFFVKGINHVANTTKLVGFKSYDSYKLAPKENQEKITPDSPFMIIDGEPVEVKLALDEKKNIVVPFIQRGHKRINLENQEAVENFILSEIKMKPEIRKSGTAFQLVDDELKKIQDRIQHDSKEAIEPDLLENLKLDSVLDNLKSQLDKTDPHKLSADQKNLRENYLKQLEKMKDKYTKMSREWEGLRKEMEDTKKDMEEGEITYEQFSTIRVRRSKALKSVEQQLIEFQEELKRDFLPHLQNFLTNLEGKKTGQK